MKISTEIDSIALHVGEEKAVELVAKTGFDAWDFSMFQMCEKKNGILVPTNHPTAQGNYLAFARKLKQIGLDNGIICNQGHAPFPSSLKSIGWLKRAIECIAEAGGEILVIHPMNNGTPKENAEMYFELLPFAKEHNVKIATENMWNWSKFLKHSKFAACATPKSFNAHLDAVNDDYFVACLDIGHAEMKGSRTNAPEMIRALGKRLKALHIHDNDKLNDSHQLPFSMNIDFVAVVKALKEIGYDGYFTLEASSYLEKFSKDNVTMGVEDLKNAAQKLADMFEEEN
ncbi:MAG: sugar phosphate isomerase/epimerase [Clostridia bacterium]|nr:sugar phosphate isomerase/epimerase [Clostridia bacterium]